MSEVYIKIIGCGDAFGSGGRAQTCFYIYTKTCNFLIDCGATSVSALKSHRIHPSNLDYILISHLHGDHFGGLPFIILDSIQNPRNKPLQIIGSQDLEECTWKLFNILYPGTEDKIDKQKFYFQEYTSLQEFETKAFSVLPFPVIHSEKVHPHGLRINFNHKIISYSGDTEWCDYLIPLSRDADVFICECCYYSASVKGHLNYQTLLAKLPQLNFKNILLTHLDEDLLKHKDSLALQCAYDGMELVIQ